MKCCSRCKIEKSLDNFPKDRKQKNGLYCYCRECVAEINLKQKKYKIDKNKIINELGRTCNSCDTFKNRTEYHGHNASKTGYKERCKVCIKNKVGITSYNTNPRCNRWDHEFYKKNKLG